MTVVQEPPALKEEHQLQPAPQHALDGLTEEMRRQGRQIRSAQRAFSIFAVLAFVIATASLLAVALKLDASPQTVVQTVATPATRPATTPAPPVHNVDVTLAQFAVTPTVKQATAGKVTFRVHNAGTITHEFVVLKTAHPAADLPLRNGRADESGNVGETGDLKAGHTKSVTFKLAPGHYAFVCNLPGHYLAGQHTDFTVR
jgi:uncharacterized cupredoxin-like copper-binding protein